MTHESGVRTDAAFDHAPITLVLVEDNRLRREGLAGLIRTEPGFSVLAASADVGEALENIRRGKPEVVLLEFGLGDHASLGLTATIHGERPEAKVIIMGLMPEQDDVADYVRAGASGFVLKDASFEVLLSTIRAVAGGVQVLPEVLTASLFTQIASDLPVHKASLGGGTRLTPREHEVVELLGEGLSNKEIANRLHIAVHTVKSHVHNVLEKLALCSRLEVAAFHHSSTSD
ncbi:MAG: response regulator transcription factor [Gemmatimonadota bacterium]|nr:response regulator transcription factor [Gemmatimonadota bacterium]